MFENHDLLLFFILLLDFCSLSFPNNISHKGLVRFKSPKAVDLAMRKFLVEEIVVQDVAVQVKVLTPSASSNGA